VLDHRANGYVRGEGVVLFCLGVRSSATKGEVDMIWMGSAINADGRSSALSAPNGIAQMLVISQGEWTTVANETS
jgi:acyl transferase domain-containing protein